MRTRTRACATAGFTVPELLVTMLVFAIVIGVTSTLFAHGARVFSRETIAVTRQNDLAAAKNVLLDDLSILGFGVPAGTNPILDVTTTGSHDRIEFLGDVNSDVEDSTPGTVERICYDVSGGVLRRSEQASGSSCGSGGWQPLASGVVGFDLSLFNAARAPIASDAAALTAGVQCFPPPAPVPVAPDANATCFVRARLRSSETVRQQVVQRRLVGEVAIRN